MCVLIFTDICYVARPSFQNCRTDSFHLVPPRWWWDKQEGEEGPLISSYHELGLQTALGACRSVRETQMPVWTPRECWALLECEVGVVKLGQKCPCVFWWPGILCRTPRLGSDRAGLELGCGRHSSASTREARPGESSCCGYIFENLPFSWFLHLQHRPGGQESWGHLLIHPPWGPPYSGSCAKMKKPPSASPCEVRAGWAPPQAQGEGPPEGDKSDPGSPLPPQPGASLGRVAAVHPLSLKKASQDTEGQVTAHFITPTQASSLCPSYLLSLTCSPVLFMVDDAASLSLSLFLRLPFPVPSALSQPPYTPKMSLNRWINCGTYAK